MATAAACPAIASAHMMLNTSATAVGTIVGFGCEKGYTLAGPPTVKCLNAGWWSGPLPTCKESELSFTRGQLIIIGVAALSSLVAFAIFLCAAYVLCRTLRTDRRRRLREKNKMADSASMMTEVYAVKQDCVGMPPVTFTTIHPTLTGRQGQIDDVGSNVSLNDWFSDPNPNPNPKPGGSREFCY